MRHSNETESRAQRSEPSLAFGGEPLIDAHNCGWLYKTTREACLQTIDGFMGQAGASGVI